MCVHQPAIQVDPNYLLRGRKPIQNFFFSFSFLFTKTLHLLQQYTLHNMSYVKPLYTKSNATKFHKKVI